MVFSSYSGDGRMLYLVPWENNTVIVGATDTEFSDKPENANITSNDVKYILNGLSGFLPNLKISESDILSSYAGLRPLLKKGKSSKDRTRDYQCWWSENKILNLAGGKLTSFRAMARTAIKKINRDFPVHGISEIKIPPKKLLNINRDGVPLKFFNEIISKYDDDAKLLFDLAKENESFNKEILSGFNIFPAEIIYFIRYQGVFHIDDLLSRRFSLSYVISKFENHKEIISKVAEIMAGELKWKNEEKEIEVSKYLDALKKIKYP